MLIILSLTCAISILLLTRLLILLLRPRATTLSSPRPAASNKHPTHLLIVLGSGGHTAEMLNMLRRLPLLQAKFTHRTYVVSSGDVFSALKAREFEREITALQSGEPGENSQEDDAYDIVIVRRARRVHQNLSSTPCSALFCLWDCIKVLMGNHSIQATSKWQRGRREASYPDLVLTNGPGTGVCVVLASLFLRFFGFCGPSASVADGKVQVTPKQQSQWRHSGQMRTIFIESWARVTTLSLSGRILLPLVDRFLVQWPTLEGRGGGKAEFVGALVA